MGKVIFLLLIIGIALVAHFMGWFDNVDWEELKDKALAANQKNKDAREKREKAREEVNQERQEMEAIDRVKHPEKYAPKAKHNSIRLEKVGFGTVALSQKKAGIVSMGLKEYFLIDFFWNQSLEDKGKKWVGRAIVGTVVAGPLGTLVGAGTGKRKIEDHSTGVIILREIKTGKSISIQVKLDAKKATEMQSFIKFQG